MSTNKQGILYTVGLLLFILLLAYLVKTGDGVMKSTHDWSEEPFTIQVHYVETQAEMDAAYVFHNNGRPTNQREAFTVWYPNERVCEIYARKPRGDLDGYRMETLGHELLHCTDGSYHPEPD